MSGVAVADRPRLAVTLGDPRGIGPEVAVAAALDPRGLSVDVVLIGPSGVVDTNGLRLLSVGSWEDGGSEAEAGRLAGRAIEEAVRLAQSGVVDAIVTAPISKPALSAAGYDWPGHTEMLRDLTGVEDTALCLAAEETPYGWPLRVVLVTGHMALCDVPGAFTLERLQTTARLAHDGLSRLWGIQRPRIAVCALNPHASDGGLFGDEERRVCEPAVDALRREGLELIGPLPADTVFVRAMRGEADVVLAPYHDLGMAAIKTAAFGKAVNVTLGLPFPRTSPDHGTAFDIARTGRADPSSMRLALESAAGFARRALTMRWRRSRLAGE